MNFINLLICCVIIAIDAVKPKLCVDCKFFTKDFLSDNKYGKCLMFPIEDKTDDYLVTGIKRKNSTNYRYCSIVRKYNSECGEEGKLYEKK